MKRYLLLIVCFTLNIDNVFAQSHAWTNWQEIPYYSVSGHIQYRMKCGEYSNNTKHTEWIVELKNNDDKDFDLGLGLSDVAEGAKIKDRNILKANSTWKTSYFLDVSCGNSTLIIGAVQLYDKKSGKKVGNQMTINFTTNY